MLRNGHNRKPRQEKRKRELDAVLACLPSKPQDPEMLRTRREFEEQLNREGAMISRVFVGNLSLTVTYKTLARVFKVCGPINHLNIGCFTYNPESTCFAEIEFNDPTAYAKATYLDGLMLEGRGIVICRRMADLPEWRKDSKRAQKVKEGKIKEEATQETQVKVEVLEPGSSEETLVGAA